MKSFMPFEAPPAHTIYRGTTPAHVFETNLDLTEAKVYVTYRQNGKNIIEKTNKDLKIGNNTVTSMLTQAETLSLKVGVVEVQIRYVTENGVSDASEPILFKVRKILKEGIITY